MAHKLPQPVQLKIGEELLGYHNNNKNETRNKLAAIKGKKKPSSNYNAASKTHH